MLLEEEILFICSLVADHEERVKNHSTGVKILCILSDAELPPDPNLVAWYKNGLPGIGALLINQADPIIVVQHLGPRDGSLVDVGMQIAPTPLVGALDNG